MFWLLWQPLVTPSLPLPLAQIARLMTVGIEKGLCKKNLFSTIISLEAVSSLHPSVLSSRYIQSC